MASTDKLILVSSDNKYMQSLPEFNLLTRYEHLSSLISTCLHVIVSTGEHQLLLSGQILPTLAKCMS